MEKKPLAVFIGMGFELTALIAIGIFVGQYFEHRYQCGGMAILAGCMLALIVWLIHFFVLFQKMDRS
jgi:hypothetical protein